MKSCADCVCMVRTTKHNWCRPFLSKPSQDTSWPPRWRELRWGHGITSINLDESEFCLAGTCRMFKPREDPKP